MVINHNLSAMYICRQINNISKYKSIAMERLSSGLRINCAADDPAGLSISQKMEAQIRGLHQASRNALDGISLIQTAEGSLNETHSILQRMRELAVQAANDTNATADRSAIQLEIDQLRSEITRIAKSTQFNEKNLLDGTASSIKLFVGANPDPSSIIEVNINNMSTSALSLDSISVGTHSAATNSISVLDNAIKSVSKQRSYLGATQNRLEFTIDNLDNYAENLEASQSRILDADMAKEMMEYAKYSVLEQVNMALLAQENQNSNRIIQLLLNSLRK